MTVHVPQSERNFPSSFPINLLSSLSRYLCNSRLVSGHLRWRACRPSPSLPSLPLPHPASLHLSRFISLSLSLLSLSLSPWHQTDKLQSPPPVLQWRTSASLRGSCHHRKPPPSRRSIKRAAMMAHEPWWAAAISSIFSVTYPLDQDDSSSY